MTNTDDPPHGRIYYPALDGLRFFAFALVFLFHGGIPQVARGIDGLVHAVVWSPVRDNLPWRPGQTVVGNGWIGVQVFFVLSGFLITTLLLEEEKRRGRIDLRAFYVRRILRIWPLYYVTVLATFTLMPWLDRTWTRPETETLWREHLPAFLVFGGNWSMGLIGQVPFDSISILWSVCVEEQFYLFCPLLIAGVRPSRRPFVVSGLMAAGVAGRYLTAWALERGAVTAVFFQFSTITHLDTLLAGVLLALTRARWEKPAVLRFLFAPTAAIGGFLLLTTPELARGGVTGRTLDYLFVWLVGSALVASATAERGVIPWVLGYGRFVWLGRISYGLYMVHEFAMFLQIVIFEWIGWPPIQKAFAPLAPLALTLGLASLSYYALERPFLRLKSRWSRVESRPV